MGLHYLTGPHLRRVPVPAFEDDLRHTREARHRTLEQVQQETRIPADVLRRFEAGTLASDPAYNEVYLKAFLRAYARAIGVPQADAVAAYDASRRGTYRGELNPEYEPGSAPPEPEPAPAGEPPAPQVASPAPPSAPTPVEALASSVDALRDGPPPLSAPIVGERVARPAVQGARRSYDKNWGAIIGLSLAVVAALAVIVWYLGFRTDASEGDAVDANGVASEIDSTAVGAGAAGGPQLQLPITVSVAASGDGLQSFRVSEDGSRAPYWIDSGTSRTFDADSSLVLWGEAESASFGDATVEFQGIRWTPADGRPVVIDRATGQRLLDSLATAGRAASAAPAAAPAP